MYGASKDWFFASQQPGIKLFDDNGIAITGDVSSSVRLWDNGTKDDVSGQTESKPIMQVANVNAAQLVKLNLAYNDVSSEFTLTITNTSGGTANETPLSPGVWAVSNYIGGQLVNSVPFFTPNALSNPEITDIAQMGNITKMTTKLSANTGVITGLSPALVVVYRGDKNPIYELGKTDSGMGLKDIAQFGNVAKLQNSLKSLPNVKGVYVAGSAPVAPGTKVTTSFTLEIFSVGSASDAKSYTSIAKASKITGEKKTYTISIKKDTHLGLKVLLNGVHQAVYVDNFSLT